METAIPPKSLPGEALEEPAKAENAPVPERLSHEGTSGARAPSNIELGDEARNALSHQCVTLDTLPASPTTNEHRILEQAGKHLSLPRFIARTLRSKRAGKISGAMEQAISRERSVLKTMESFCTRTFYAMAKAWEEAGAPGEMGIEAKIGAEAMRQASRARKVRALNENRVELRTHLDQHARRVREHLGHIEARVTAVDAEMEIVLGAHAAAASGAHGVMDTLRSSLPGEAQAWLDGAEPLALSKHLAERIAELRAERERLDAERSQAEASIEMETQTVHQRLAQLDEEIAGLRGQSMAEADELRKSMIRIGRELEPIALSFANGEQVCAALAGARQRETESRQCISRLESVHRDLQEHSGLKAA
jgi:hypothetical protein